MARSEVLRFTIETANISWKSCSKSRLFSTLLSVFDFYSLSPSPFTKIPFDLDYFWYCLILRCCLRKSTIVLMRFCSLSALVHGFLPYAGLYIGLENILLAHCVSVLWRTCACIVTVVCYCNEGLSRIMFLTD